MGNSFQCYFSQLFMYLALEIVNNERNILKISRVPDFCPLKADTARFSMGFRLKLFGREPKKFFILK